MAEVVKLVYPATGLTSPTSWGSKESIKKQKNAKRSVYKYFMSINVMLN